MKTQLLADGNGHYHLEFSDVPEYCHALKMAPDTIELELTLGTWLILLVSVWSATDVNAIEEAINVTEELKKQNKNLALGIRPFDMYEEIQKWCNDAQGASGTPIWLFLHNGKMVAKQRGLMPKEILIAWISEAFHVITPQA